MNRESLKTNHFFIVNRVEKKLIMKSCRAHLFKLKEKDINGMRELAKSIVFETINLAKTEVILILIKS